MDMGRVEVKAMARVQARDLETGWEKDLETEEGLFEVSGAFVSVLAAETGWVMDVETVGVTDRGMVLEKAGEKVVEMLGQAARQIQDRVRM